MLKHFTVYNGVNIETINAIGEKASRDDLRAHLSVAKEEQFILAVGRLTEQKGYIYLLEAMSLLVQDCPNLRLMIFGDGEQYDELIEQIGRLSLHNNVRIHKPTHSIISIMCASDLFVFPSLYEGLPMVLLESMAVGIPIVATNVTGISEVVTDGYNGRLVESKNVKELAKIIREVIGDKELGLRLVANARSTIHEKFNVEQMVEAYERLYGERSV